MIDKFRDSFREEAYELLNELESSLLELESNPDNEDRISSVFRSMHTIKGSASMFGFTHISEFTHEIENVMDLLRSGTLEATKELIDLTLEARDHIRGLLDLEGEPGEEDRAKSSELVDRFRAIVPADGADQQADAEASPSSKGAASADQGETRTFRIRFTPKPEIYLNGTNPLMLLTELEALGEYSCFALSDEIPALPDLDPERCLVRWDLVLTTSEGRNAIEDVFLFVQDTADVRIDEIDDLSDIEESSYKRLGQILVERGIVDVNAVDEAIHSQKRIGEVLIEKGVPRSQVESALDEQEHVRRTRERVQGELTTASIRVSADKLDQMVDLVGELVTLQARLTQTTQECGIAALTSISENLERLTDELRDSTMSIRMVPIGTTFSKFRRLVRDLALELGKQAEIVTSGGETELDKTVIERLNDPLVHIIRNSLDHGVEMPEERRTAGKPPVGTVTLTAEHSGGSVLITVNDDGGGLDTAAILRRARERGLISESAELSEQEIHQLVTAPGFSTAERITQLSGRGVGMDVVRKEIESLGGTVEIESESGAGTTVRLNIPLTLAIIDGLLVRIGSEHFVIPLSAVEECVELVRDQTVEKGGRRLINNRGELLPYIRLREFFSITDDAPPIEQIVVAHAAGERVGFVVDTVIGDHQTVIKNLGKLYRGIEGISGATILGDGSVALILDVQKLANLAGAAMVGART